MRKLLLFTCCMSFTFMAMAQWRFNYGPELGAGKGIFGGNMQLTPIVGLHGKLVYRNHWIAGVGIQYQSLGLDQSNQQEHSFFKGDPPVLTHQRIEESSKLKFHTLALPISVGYQYRIGAFTPAVFAGLRPNFLVAGTYERTVTLYIDGREESQLNRKLNPMNEAEMSLYHSLIWQHFLGASLSFKNKLELSFSYNWGGPISAYERMEFPADILYGAQLDNKQAVLSLKYYLR